MSVWRAETVGEYVDRKQVNPLVRAAVGFFSLAFACFVVGLLPSFPGWATVAGVLDVFGVGVDPAALEGVAFFLAIASFVLAGGLLAAAPFAFRKAPWRGEVLRRVLHVIVSDGSGTIKLIDRSTPMNNVGAKVRRKRYMVEVRLSTAYFDPLLWSTEEARALLGASSIANDGDKLAIYYGDGLARAYDRAERKAGLR